MKSHPPTEIKHQTTKPPAAPSDPKKGQSEEENANESWLRIHGKGAGKIAGIFLVFFVSAVKLAKELKKFWAENFGDKKKKKKTEKADDEVKSV